MANEDVTLTYGADLSALKRALGDLASISFAGGALGLIGGVTAALAATAGILRSSTVAALEGEQANKKLAEAVKNAGSAFSYSYAQLKESSSVLQSQSSFSAEQIEAAQKVLIQHRLTGEQFRETQRLALDMAADLGGPPVESAKRLAQALEDPTKGLGRLRLAGISVSQASREEITRLAELGDMYGAQKALLTELQAKYGGLSATIAGTVTGGWTQLVNVVKDLREAIGQELLPYLEELLPVARATVLVFTDWAKESIQLVGALGNPSWVSNFREAMIDAFSQLLALLQKTGVAFDVLVAKLQYFWAQAINYIETYKYTLSGAAVGGLAGGLAGGPGGTAIGGAAGGGLGFLADTTRASVGLGPSAADDMRLKELAEKVVQANKAFSDLNPDVAALAKEIKARMTPGTGDGLDEGPRGGGSYIPQGASLGPAEGDMFGSAIASSMAMGLQQSGVLDTLKTASNERVAALAEQIKSSVSATGNGKEAFQSGFEDTISTFKRIQTSQASVAEVEQRQLTALEKLVISESERRTRDESRNTTLLEISGALKNGVPAVAQ